LTNKKKTVKYEDLQTYKHKNTIEPKLKHIVLVSTLQQSNYHKPKPILY
jgi:hypothetical protein